LVSIRKVKKNTNKLLDTTNKIDSLSVTQQNMNTTKLSRTNTHDTINLTSNKFNKKIIKDEKDIEIVNVEPHNKYNLDDELDKLRKNKEILKKQKLEQMKKLKEIQNEEEQQRKQMQKLQAEMKTKPFV
jgi:hypothetical protein